MYRRPAALTAVVSLCHVHVLAALTRTTAFFDIIPTLDSSIEHQTLGEAIGWLCMQQQSDCYLGRLGRTAVGFVAVS